MVVSNEPGYYEDGAFGIRIENLLVIKEMDTPFRFGGQSYLGFERLTFCPLQHKMIALEVGPLDPCLYLYHLLPSSSMETNDCCIPLSMVNHRAIESNFQNGA